MQVIDSRVQSFYFEFQKYPHVAKWKEKSRNQSMLLRKCHLGKSGGLKEVVFTYIVKGFHSLPGPFTAILLISDDPEVALIAHDGDGLSRDIGRDFSPKFWI